MNRERSDGLVPVFLFSTSSFCPHKGSGNLHFLLNPYGSALTGVWDHLSLVGKERWKESRVKNPRFLTISLALPDRPPRSTTNASDDHIQRWQRFSSRFRTVSQSVIHVTGSDNQPYCLFSLSQKRFVECGSLDGALRKSKGKSLENRKVF